MEVDHIAPRSGLDNRKENLRLVEHSDNLRNRGLQRNNTSGYRGVMYYRGRGNWIARLKTKGISVNLGYFSSAEKAHERYVEECQKRGLLMAEEG
jgi:hypothetical protein